MKNLPERIIRMDDGAEFILNPKTKLYGIKLSNGLDPMFSYTFERLMEDPRSKGSFKIANGTENIKSMKENWFKKMKSLMRKNRGCGDDGD